MSEQKQLNSEQKSLIKYSKLNSAYYKTSGEDGLAVPMAAQNALPKHTLSASINNANRIIAQNNTNSLALYSTSSAQMHSYGGNSGGYGGNVGTTQHQQKVEQTISSAGIAHSFIAIATPVRHFDAKFADDNIASNDIAKRAEPEGGSAQHDDTGNTSTVVLPLTTDKFVYVFVGILGAIYSLIKNMIVK